MESLFLYLDKLPKEAILLVVFLMFILQIVKLIADITTKANRSRADGVSHLKIYERLGEQHGDISLITKKLDEFSIHIKSLENNLRLHTVDDKRFSEEIIMRLDSLVGEKGKGKGEA